MPAMNVHHPRDALLPGCVTDASGPPSSRGAGTPRSRRVHHRVALEVDLGGALRRVGDLQDELTEPERVVLLGGEPLAPRRSRAPTPRARAGPPPSRASRRGRLRARRGRASVEVDHRVLDARVVVERVDGQVLAVAGLLEAAVRHLRQERQVVVDPDAAEVERADRVQGPADVACPDRGGEAVRARRWRSGSPRRRRSTRWTVTTGPKTSLWMISASWAAPVTTVGSTKYPRSRAGRAAEQARSRRRSWRGRGTRARAAAGRPRRPGPSRSRRPRRDRRRAAKRRPARAPRAARRSTPGVAITRAAAVQSWPELQKLATRRPAATFAGSASSSTTTGALPPSSRCTRLSVSAAARAIHLPVRDAAGQRDQRDVAVA